MIDNIGQDVGIRGEGNIVVGKGDVIINPLAPAETRLRRDLGILLKNVETTWVKGVLEKSVHETALLELGMELREEAVDNPWHMVIEKPDQSQEVISQGRKLLDVFDEANRLLLILGEPGSGKTTTLLQLARDLIAEVDPAFTQPIPVILNLSTWTNKQQPLDEWLIAELGSKYRVPKKDGKKWLQERRILPLLDGLDEVKAENRAACVENINQLVNEYGLQGLVVCSRIKDYTDLNVRLAFYRAIYLQHLTPQQVDEYLNRAGDKLASLRTTLQSDEALRSMAQSPLILNIMSLAYQNASSDSISDPTLNTREARSKHLLDTYIERMFKRKADKQEYDAEQTKQRLAWLAKNMQKHNQDVFLIEGLQPSWLQSRGWRSIYALISRFLSVLSIVLISLILSFDSDFFATLITGILTGLSISFFDILRFEWLEKWRERKQISQFWWSFINIVSIALIVAGISGVTIGLGIGLRNGQISMMLDLFRIMFPQISFFGLGMIYGLAAGLTYGLIFGIRGSRRGLMNDIQTVEALRWNWRKARKGWLITGIITGLTMAPFAALGMLIAMRTTAPGVNISNLSIVDFIIALIIGLVGGLVLLGPIAAVFNGISREIIETKTTPNQGIRLSVRNALIGSLVFGLIGVVIGLITFKLNNSMNFSETPDLYQLQNVMTGETVMLNIAVSFLMIGAILYGGFDVIQHYVLRVILVFQGHTPHNYARFLDHAVDRIFLQKVGGGYRFIHRLLLEHFAEMVEEKT